MKILIMDKDALACQLLQKRLTDKGLQVLCEADKNKALDVLKTEDYELIMLDPTPLQDPRPIIISIYKTLRGRYEPQFLILSKTIDEQAALSAGANDIIQKPVSPQALEEKLENMQRLMEYISALGHEDHFPSQKGVIGKDAFNELFLSAIDRAHRYAERSFIVFIDIHADDADFDKMAANIRYIRRQSDVIGRTCAKQFGILLQRPMYESEPMDAMTRFAEVLTRQMQETALSAPVEITLTLVELPFGRLHNNIEITNGK